MKKLVSICLLAYERPEYLGKTLRNLAKTSYPHELIVHNDGSSNILVKNVIDAFADRISFVIDNLGKNMGVGWALRHCIGVSHGEYIVKYDADLECETNWLDAGVSIMEKNSDVIAVGFFNYRNYAPNDNRFNILEEREDCYIVDDFVNSAYLARSEDFKNDITKIEDDGFHQYLKSKHNKKLAITKRDYVANFGFGLGKSVYMTPDGQKAVTYSEPKVLGE